DPLVPRPVAEKPRLASSIVWLDALVSNVDRSAKNTNLLVWHKELWMIDHGASLIFHHSWDQHLERARNPYKQIREHVLLPWATELREADAELAPRLTREAIDGVLARIPDDWLGDEPKFASLAEHRAAYRDVLLRRLDAPREWVEDAARAQASRL
ncbi:MAG TPA: aminotransferase class I and II, partial [Thermoanaerobaculia bacterium]|nr:aminotransferase class I and II [Thermoanaerobaculia bacterium]